MPCSAAEKRDRVKPRALRGIARVGVQRPRHRSGCQGSGISVVAPRRSDRADVFSFVAAGRVEIARDGQAEHAHAVPDARRVEVCHPR